MKNKQPDRPLPVYEIPEHELEYWNALDDRKTCEGCRNRSDIWCNAKPRKMIYPPNLKHRCEDRK